MKTIKKKIIFSFIIAVLFSLMLLVECDAATEYPDISNDWFYIKNAYTGHYLDVNNGIAQGGTNVQQCEYNRFLCTKVVY